MEKVEKMTQGWVVYGGMRHGELQREMFPRSYEKVATMEKETLKGGLQC
jgi:hypothetical protein